MAPTPPILHRRTRPHFLIVAALFCTLLLSACDLQALAGPSPTPTASDTPPPSATSTATATATVPPTATSTATASHTPTTSPTATLTHTPSATPTVYAVVSSQRRTNVRRGPGVDFPVTVLLAPGSGVQVIGTNDDATWYQVRLSTGGEGWINAALLELEAPLPPPPIDAAPDDTALISEETRIVVELAGEEPSVSADPADDILVIEVPIVDLAVLHATATAIIGATGTADALSTAADSAASTSVPATETPAATRPPVTPRLDVNVFAFCDDPAFGIAAPRDLTPGSTIRIFWAWFASNETYLRQHLSNATHELRVNGSEIRNVNAYRGNPSRSGAQHVVYWYLPYGPLDPGEYTITYRVTWQNAISDGVDRFGPGTATEFEEESCTFSVR